MNVALFMSICVMFMFRLDEALFPVSQFITASASSSELSLPTSASAQIRSPLYDQTLQWDHELPHLWLEYEKYQSSLLHQLQEEPQQLPPPPIQKPPYMILLTNYEWNHPNQSKALRYSRCIRSSELYQAIINHPYFHPHAYEQIQQGTRSVDPNVRYYVYLDVETCFEANYPQYGRSYYGNCDTSYGRSAYSTHVMKRRAPCYNFASCHYIEQELRTNPIFTFTPTSSTTTTTTTTTDNNNRDSPTTTTTTPTNSSQNRLVILDCRGNGQSVSFRQQQQTSSQLAMVSLSSTAQQLQLSVDQGLPPPAIRTIQLSTNEQAAIQSCTNNNNHNSNNHDDENNTDRTFWLSFAGSYQRHAIRKKLAQLDTTTTTTMMRRGKRRHRHGSVILPSNGNHTILITDTKRLQKRYQNLTYTDLLKQSKFAAVPRGDNLYSYRFTEVLAAGAIPVLFANQDWVLPFRTELVDWDACIIRIDDVNISNTVSILQGYMAESSSLSQPLPSGGGGYCERQQYCYHIYQTYIATSAHVVRGIMEGLEAIVVSVAE
jgi:hypothetical protein